MKRTREFQHQLTIAAIGIACLIPGPALAQAGDAGREPVVSLEAAYTAELWQNTGGGLRRKNAYLDNLDLVATVDVERAIGLAGTTIAVSALYNNRSTLSDRIIGDTQVISNIDTDGSLRLYEAWIEHDFGTGALKTGLIDLNSEFDVNETGALFVGSSHGVGADFSQIGENGPSIFPITGLAALAKLDVSSKFKLRTGIFEGIPGDIEKPRKTVLRLDGNEGYLLVGEVEANPWKDSRIVLGLRRLSRRDATSGTPGIPARKAQFGGYALIEGSLAEIDAGTLRAFARLGLADPDTHDISGYLGTGISFSGRVLGSGDQSEQIGLAVGIIRNSAQFRSDQSAAGSPVDRHEAAIELSYRIEPMKQVAVQPDVQYVINPGTNPSLRNALAVGLRLELVWQGGF